MAECRQQFMEFVEAAMNVADDVEGAGFVSAIVPQPFANHGRGVDVVRRAQHMQATKPLAFQGSQ